MIRHCAGSFFEFQAGGGKTKVLSVILAARAQREGKVPFFFSLPSLFDIVKEDLKASLQQVYHQGVVPFSIPLGQTLSPNDIVALKKLLERKDSCFVTDPETWHSLRLQWQDALSAPQYATGIKDKADSLGEILHNFKTHALFFIDEEHRNVSSMTEANRAYGQSSPYSEYQSRLLRKCYDALYGWIEEPLMLSNGKYLHQELGLADNRQVFLPDEMKKEILDKLAEYLMPFLHVPTEHQTEILAYLKDKQHPTPKLFEMIEQKKSEAKERGLQQDENFCCKIDMAKGLVSLVLPHAFSQRGLMDYGPSVNVNDDVFDPYILGDPAGPKFQDPDIAAALTVQGLRQQGLNIHQIKRYLGQKLGQLNEARNGGISDVKLFMRKFNNLGPPEKYPLENLELKDLDNPLLLDAYSQAFAKNRHVVQEYEKQFALKNVKVYPFKLCSTSQELSMGASAVVHTSATLGVPEENPYIEELSDLFLTTPEFMADVVQRALLPHNQEKHWVEESTPLQVLNQLYKQGVDFSRVDGIINMGGLCKDASSSAWEEALLALNEKYQLGYAGVIIAKNERVGDGFDKRLYIVRPGEANIPLQGSDVKLALKQLNLDEQRFFKIYPPEMTTGTDLSLAPDAKMIFTIGQNISLATCVQGIMRMRGFLQNPIDPATSQSLIWVGSKHIERMLLDQFQEASPRAALLNAVLCQIIQEKEAIRMRALQDIEMVIRGVVEEIVTANSEEYSKHRYAFEISMGNDPRAKYGVQTALENTDEYLWKHAKEFSKMANIDLDQFPVARERIALAIEQAKKKVAKMESASKSSFGATLHQQQEAQQKQQQMTQQRAFNYITPQGNQPVSEIDYASGSLAFGRRTALVLDPSWQANSLLSGRSTKVATPLENLNSSGGLPPTVSDLLGMGMHFKGQGLWDKTSMSKERLSLAIRPNIVLPTAQSTANFLSFEILSTVRLPMPTSMEEDLFWTGQPRALLPGQSRQAKSRLVSDMKWLSPNLYLMPNFYQTTTTSKPGEDLKPATFILATLDRVTGKRDYRVISIEDAKIYSAQLQEGNRHGEVEQTGFIFTSNGSIHQTDRSAGGLLPAEIEEWQRSDEFCQLLAQIGLIDGRRIEDAWQWKLVQQHPEALEDLNVIWENHLLRNDTTFQQNVTSLLSMLKRPYLYS